MKNEADSAVAMAADDSMLRLCSMRAGHLTGAATSLAPPRRNPSPPRDPYLGNDISVMTVAVAGNHLTGGWRRRRSDVVHTATTFTTYRVNAMTVTRRGVGPSCDAVAMAA